MKKSQEQFRTFSIVCAKYHLDALKKQQTPHKNTQNESKSSISRRKNRAYIEALVEFGFLATRKNKIQLDSSVETQTQPGGGSRWTRLFLRERSKKHTSRRLPMKDITKLPIRKKFLRRVQHKHSK